MSELSPETDALRAAIAQAFEDHAPADTRGMAGHYRPHFWMRVCGTFEHGKQGHREHLIDALVDVVCRPEGER